MTFDEIFPLIGENGMFQKLLVLTFAVTLLGIGMQPVLATFITLTPTWQCTGNGSTSSECPWNGTFPGEDERRCNTSRNNWEYTEEENFSLVTQFELDCERKSVVTLVVAVFFVGWGIGALVSGAVSDRFGRRVALLPSLMTIFLLGFASPFVTNMYVVVAFRFLIGFAFPSFLTQAQILVAEFVGRSARPYALGAMACMFNFSWMVLGVKAYFVRNWMDLSIVCTAPYVLIVSVYIFIPESARWLHLHNRNEEAMKVIRNIAKCNHQKLPENVSFPTLVTTDPSFPPRPMQNVFHLFKSSKLASQTLAVMLLWACSSLQMYGLQFAASDLGGTVYTNFILLSTAGIPGAIGASVSANKYGRKTTSLASVISCGIACFAIAALPDSGVYKAARLVLGVFGRFCGIIVATCLYTWSPELYSTDIRAAVMGLLQLSARVGSGLSPLVVIEAAKYGDWIPFVIIGVISFAAAGLGLILPETKGKKLGEIAYT